MSDLLTIDEYLKAVGKAPGDTDPQEIGKYQTAIEFASQAIRDYTDRDLILNADAVQGSRQFRYYGNGIIEIDDCSVVSEVDVTATAWSPFSRTLQLMEWIAGPQEKTIKNYIELWTTIPFPDSPEMGFQWNADRYAPAPRPIIFTVTAVWGWDAIPAPVKSAAVLVATEMALQESPYIAEAIEGYSHTFGSSRAAATTPIGAIPPRAQSLLDPYVRVNV